ncbi:MAG: TIM barrel protein [Anaerolineae bacterium]
MILFAPPDRLLFGTSGVPDSSPKPSSEAGIIRTRELGLGCMEMAMVQKVTITEPTAAKVRATAERESIYLSIHAPYYINLNSKDPQKLADSQQRVLAAARAGDWTGARNIVLHIAFYHDNTPAETTAIIRDNLLPIMETLKAEGSQVVLRPETMGKLSQWGDLDETLDLCVQVPGLQPCIDFAHLHARHGRDNTYDEFLAILDRVGDRLGERALRDLHIHISGIAYGPKGEQHHLTFADADFNYRDCLRALRDRNCAGLVVGESPARELDVIFLKNVWQEVLDERDMG